MKPSIQNTLALGTLLEELGVDAQVGASGLTNVLSIAGKNLGGFANQMGSTKEEAKALLSADPTEFVKKFSKSFEGVGPEELALKLNKLKLNSNEVKKVIGALSSGTERLTELQIASSKAFKDGTSLQNEAAKKNETTAAKIAIMKNKMQALAITIGQALLPVISDLIKSVTPIIKKFSRWAKNNKRLLGTIVKVVAIVGGLALALSGVFFVVGVATKAMALFNLVLSANPIGLVIAGVALLGVGLYALSGKLSGLSNTQKLNNEVTQRALENTVDQRVEVKLLFNALRRAEEGSKAYNDTLDKLETLQPGIIEQFGLQEKAIDKINEAEKNLIKTIMRRAREQARTEKMEEKTNEIVRLEDEGFGYLEGFGNAMFGSDIFNSEKEEIAKLNKELEVLAAMNFDEDTETKQGVNPKKSEKDAQTKTITESIQKNKMELILPPGFGLRQAEGGGTSMFNVMPNLGLTGGQ